MSCLSLVLEGQAKTVAVFENASTAWGMGCLSNTLLGLASTVVDTDKGKLRVEGLAGCLVSLAGGGTDSLGTSGIMNNCYDVLWHLQVRHGTS